MRVCTEKSDNKKMFLSTWFLIFREFVCIKLLLSSSQDDFHNVIALRGMCDTDMRLSHNQSEESADSISPRQPMH